MPLRIERTNEEGLVGAAVQDGLRQGLAAHGRVTLLVPSFPQALEAQKALATLGGLSLALTVTTPLAWTKERWEVWGDGTHVVEPTARLVLVTDVLSAFKNEPDAPAVNPGTVNMLSKLVQDLPWLPLDPSGEVEEDVCLASGLTRRETGMVRAAARYARELASRGLVEECQAMDRLPGLLRAAGVDLGTFVVAGFSNLERRQRELLLGLSAVGLVTLVAPAGEGVALQSARDLADALASVARAGDVEVIEERVDAAAGAERSEELTQLLAALFEPARDGTVEPAGSVGLLEPSGPLAEAELVARTVSDLAADGVGTVVVTAPDVRRAWRELVPKLCARGILVRAQLSVPVLEAEAGRAFFEYANTVATLAELAQTWPAPEETPEGTLVRLGDMSWWPPEHLVDFLRSDIAHMPPDKVMRLDAAWRGNRLLTPADVLDALQNPRRTSGPVAQATRELLLGRLGSAASKLLAPYVMKSQEDGPQARPGQTAPVQAAGPALEDAEAMGVLTAVLSVAGTLKELGISAARDAASPVSLGTLVKTAYIALQQTGIAMKPSCGDAGASCEAEIVAPAGAATMRPASRDALIACGLTAAESPLPKADDALSAMLEALGVEPKADGLARARWSFHGLCAVPRRKLILERTLFDASSKDAYPAVVLSELLACYGERAEDLWRRGRGEDAAEENVRAAGAFPRETSEEVPCAAGKISDDLRRFILVPPPGSAELPGGRPLLSASQIESYLECPLKWFSLRRLGLGDSDAGHGPVEMGVFAHRVLELTHTQLLEQGLDALGRRGEAVPDLVAEPWQRVPGSGVGVDNLARAQQILDEAFQSHRRHMYLPAGKGRVAYQALIAHDATDEGQEAQLRRDLLSTLDYESVCFMGFEPRLFEWKFGGRDDPEEYAGAFINGTVDRLDVDAHGQAIVIDYKHKGPAGFFAEYAAFPKEGREAGSPLELPRRVQTLIYAQVVRRRFPDLKVVGAVYLGTRGNHELSGAVGTNVLDRVLGKMPADSRAARLGVSDLDNFGTGDERGMDALLDATERQIAQAVELMRAGHIDADPKDAEACSYCPVLNCQRRIRK